MQVNTRHAIAYRVVGLESSVVLSKPQTFASSKSTCGLVAINNACSYHLSYCNNCNAIPIYVPKKLVTRRRASSLPSTAALAEVARLVSEDPAAAYWRRHKGSHKVEEETSWVFPARIRCIVYWFIDSPRRHDFVSKKRFLSLHNKTAAT